MILGSEFRLKDEYSGCNSSRTCSCNFLGTESFPSLGHGDDVKEKKPDPSIYQTSVKRLGVSEKDCLVVEDSVSGLQAFEAGATKDNQGKEVLDISEKGVVGFVM
uniref:Uncharacterized protein n=1 Tax=Vitis vinifera TaxID=29760 RepID=F6I251_VITVI